MDLRQLVVGKLLDEVVHEFSANITHWL
jgi:hypothetical protein